MWVFSAQEHPLADAVLHFLPLGKIILRWSYVVWHIWFVLSLKLNVPYVFNSIWEYQWNRNAKYSVGLSKDIIQFQPCLCFSELCCDGNMEAFCSFFFFLILTMRSKTFFRALSGILATLCKLYLTEGAYISAVWLHKLSMDWSEISEKISNWGLEVRTLKSVSKKSADLGQVASHLWSSTSPLKRVCFFLIGV